ncbi:hypothetical protein Pan153_04390 [Gimesia panareensis]|uniref:Uncharacterized protein n=1 Tax=Gimesia panareensis TaxID=2527978 RepID=A0A518FHT4_9PLAN|nr:hypothetical protein Pan153_04390 [Gimesia panareensis]
MVSGADFRKPAPFSLTIFIYRGEFLFCKMVCLVSGLAGALCHWNVFPSGVCIAIKVARRADTWVRPYDWMSIRPYLWRSV